MQDLGTDPRTLGITTEGGGTVLSPNAPSNVLAHELGHYGGYSSPAPYVNPKTGEIDPKHSDDPNNIMFPYNSPTSSNNVDCPYCKALQKLGK